MAVLMDMPTLAAALNEEGWEWLLENAPVLAAAVRTEVERGATADELRRFVMRYAKRPQLAERVQLAAAHLTAVRHGNG